ncbi:hypothetical protein K469DRAFT_586259 [Zopfia rhizophila CBS 207.26]|uniref:Acid protease n=1 Tax=Zopfia rhizophila CBS 207.26 TaxID=1314779 RepID=A0A6A6DU76_9PEZI|nr:hypothetical protein K469DRAFT_586259 [Zopfia rhizophila CBS 207.26]
MLTSNVWKTCKRTSPLTCFIVNIRSNGQVEKLAVCKYPILNCGFCADYYELKGPSNNTAVGFLKIENMQYPSVQLEHTAFVSSVACSNNSIRVAFNNRKAFSVAQADWSSYKSGVLLITADPKCRLSTEVMERGYVLVKNMTADNSTMTVIGQSEPVSFVQAVGQETPIDFSFGNFQANSTDGFNIPATGPPGKANGTAVYPPSSPANTTLRDPSGDSGFDEDLDRKIGVMTTEEFETQMLRRYNVTLEDISGDDDIPDLLPGFGLRRRHLVRRGLFKSIKKGLKKSFNKDFTFDTKKNQQTKQTPWGVGVELFSKTTPGGSGSAAVYCVDCGADGKMVLQGKVTFSVIKGLETGYISADGNLHAGLQIGIVASYKDHWGFEKDIVTVPLTPYTIPGIITLGPSLSLAAGAELDILAEGQLLAGITADVPNFSARFDLKDQEKSVIPNFGPQAKPVFDGKGKIVISADAFLALKLAVGSLLVLADLAGAIYFPVVCMYEERVYPKLFLAKDPVDGVAKLEDAKLEGVITGSKVKDCGYLPMKHDALH